MKWVHVGPGIHVDVVNPFIHQPAMDGRCLKPFATSLRPFLSSVLSQCHGGCAWKDPGVTCKDFVSHTKHGGTTSNDTVPLLQI